MVESFTCSVFKTTLHGPQSFKQNLDFVWTKTESKRFRPPISPYQTLHLDSVNCLQSVISQKTYSSTTIETLETYFHLEHSHRSVRSLKCKRTLTLLVTSKKHRSKNCQQTAYTPKLTDKQMQEELQLENQCSVKLLQSVFEAMLVIVDLTCTPIWT